MAESMQFNAGGTASQVLEQVEQQYERLPTGSLDAGDLMRLVDDLVRGCGDDDSVSVSARVDYPDAGGFTVALTFTAVPRFKADAQVRAGLAPDGLAGAGSPGEDTPTTSPQGDDMASTKGAGTGRTRAGAKTGGTKGGGTKGGGTKGGQNGAGSAVRTGGQGDQVNGPKGTTQGETGHAQGEGSKAQE